MKKNLLLSCLLLSLFHIANSQCSVVPVKEAVRNGDFELGYLGGTVFTGNASPSNTHPGTGGGGAMDFSTDLKYGGMWSQTGACKYSLSNQYGVGRVENPPCLNGTKALVYGQYASSGTNYKDHTKGTDQGFALIIDFDDPSDNVVGVWKKAWAQNVNVYPNQTYWFSAWFAQYAANSTPNMRFKVQWQDAGGVNIGAPVIVGTAAPTQAWNFDQFKGSTISPINAAKAIVTIECDPTGIANSDDMIIDDISFINSCQNIATSASYSVKFANDSVNLCVEGGSYVAQVLKTSGGNLTAAGKVITWYTGSGSPQTVVAAWANQVNPSITAAGEYRVCVQDAGNGCDVSATIIAYESVAYTPPNVTLCSPAQYTYDAGYTFPNSAMTIAWSGPSGAGTGKTYVANKAGSHTVTITPAGGHAGCALTKTFTVTSNLPVAPTNLEYCDGGGSSTTLTMGDGKPYRWSTSQTMTPLIGSGNSVSWTPAGGTTGDQILWMQSAGTTPLGTVGPTTIATYAAVRPVTFTTTGSTVLSSFIVNVPGYSCAWGTTFMPVTFNITGQAPYTQNVNCGSNTTITPNWTLPAGTYTLSTTSPDLLTGSGGPTSAGGGKVAIINPPGDGLYTMGNLTFSNSDACDPIPVTIKAKSCCTPPADNPDIDLVTSVLSICTPGKATIVSKTGLTNGLDYKWQVSHDGGTTWGDSAGTTGVVAGGKVTLNNVAAAGSYRLVVATAGNINKSCVKNSPAVVVVIKPLPANITITVNPNQTQFCKGVAHQLTASATAGSTFQWKYDGSGTAATTTGKTTVGPHNYKVVATLNGCVDSSAMKIITVNPSDSAKILPAGPFCSVDPNYTMKLTAGSTSGGTWSGTGVSAAGVFSPATGNGTYAINYTTAGVCPTSDNINVTVSNSVTLSITSTKSSYCHNAAKDTIEVTALGGKFSTWSGKGITDVDFGYYDPKLADVGNDTIWYIKAGSCGDTTFKAITITSTDTAKITLGQGPFCQSQGVVTLAKEAVSNAGTWSGTGITNGATGTFDPSIGAGSYLITYKTSGSCPYQDTATIKVVGQKIANIVTADTTMCKNATAKQIKLSTNTTVGGTWLSAPTTGLVSNTGVFNPTASGVGVYKVYYVIPGATLGCSAADSVLITVSAIDTAKITIGQGPFCLNDPVQTLRVEAASSAGVWSGTGITNTTTGAFNPATATVGPHLITYKTSGGCFVQDTMTIYVVNQMIANITNTTASVCEDAGLYTIQKSGNTTPGGTWMSVPAGMVNSNGQFNPSLATAGTTYKVLYTVSGATPTCSAKDSIDIIVVVREEAQITSGTSMSLCTYDAAVQLTTLNTGGTWSGTGVNGTGMFTPSVAIAGGPYAVKYKINGSGLCPDEDTINITIIAPKNATIQAAGPFCENLPKQQLVPNVAGGTFSGAGVNASGLFDPAAAGQGLHWIKYTQGGLCSNSDSIQIQVDALPSAVIVPDVAGGCIPVTINFGDSSTADVATAHWDFGDGSTKDMTSADASTSHQFTQAGNGITVSLSVVFLNGCVDNTTTKVSVTTVPIADFSFDPLPANTNDPQITFVNQSTDASSYHWNFGTTGSPDTSANVNEVVLFDAPNGDTLPVTLIAKNAVCVDSITKLVYIKDVFTLFTANAFTPNGDGNNDVFYPQGKNHVCDECSNYEFLIFDRWGEVIFKSSTAYEGWNGKRANILRDAEVDVYVWKLTYTDSYTGKEKVSTGHITLLR